MGWIGSASSIDDGSLVPCILPIHSAYSPSLHPPSHQLHPRVLPSKPAGHNPQSHSMGCSWSAIDPEVDFAFAGDRRGVTSFDIPAGYTAIGEGAFVSQPFPIKPNPSNSNPISSTAQESCHSLTTIRIPKGVITIRKHAVAGCESLSSIIFPDTLTTVEKFAFDQCSSLSHVVIPESVTKFEKNAFRDCTELKRRADAAGLSIEEWGRMNWRNLRRNNLRFAVVSCVTKLRDFSEKDLEIHLKIIKRTIVGDCIRFLVEVGEPGLLREIVGYLA
jgi:hypothetical protein